MPSSRATASSPVAGRRPSSSPRAPRTEPFGEIGRASEVAQLLEHVGSLPPEGGVIRLLGAAGVGRGSVGTLVARQLAQAGLLAMHVDAAAARSLEDLAGALLESTVRALGNDAAARALGMTAFEAFGPAMTPGADGAPATLHVTMPAGDAPVSRGIYLRSAIASVRRAAAGRRRPAILVLEDLEALDLLIGQPSGPSLVDRERVGTRVASPLAARFPVVSPTTGAAASAAEQGALAVLVTASEPQHAAWATLTFAVDVADWDALVAEVVQRARRAGRPAARDVASQMVELTEGRPRALDRVLTTAIRMAADRDALAPRDVGLAFDDVLEARSEEYALRWRLMTGIQRTVAVHLARTANAGLFTRSTVRALGLAASTMQRAVEGLERIGVVRRSVTADGPTRVTIPDPFLRRWLARHPGPVRTVVSE